jgi:hypothetical protein
MKVRESRELVNSRKLVETRRKEQRRVTILENVTIRNCLVPIVEKSRVIPRKAPVWLVDLWKYESSHELHSTAMEERFIRFLYDVKGLPKRKKIQK